MATVTDITNRAIKFMRVKPAGQSVDGAYSTDALEAYNAVMFELSADYSLKDSAGVAYTHAEQALAGTFPLADKFKDPIAAAVAVRTHTSIGLELPLEPEVHSLVSRLYGQLNGDFPVTVTQDQGMLRKRMFYS